MNIERHLKNMCGINLDSYEEACSLENKLGQERSTNPCCIVQSTVPMSVWPPHDDFLLKIFCCRWASSDHVKPSKPPWSYTVMLLSFLTSSKRFQSPKTAEFCFQHVHRGIQLSRRGVCLKHRASIQHCRPVFLKVSSLDHLNQTQVWWSLYIQIPRLHQTVSSQYLGAYSQIYIFNWFSQDVFNFIKLITFTEFHYCSLSCAAILGPNQASSQLYFVWESNTSSERPGSCFLDSELLCL